jgi:hypothetical protein
MLSVSVVVLAVVTEIGVGVGVGDVNQGHIVPSSANVETESKRVKMAAAKSCCSFFMIFPAKVKLQTQAERPVWEESTLPSYSHLLVSHAVENAV